MSGIVQFFTDLPQYTFLQYAVVACILASISAGVVGSIIVVRRTTYIAGAISHCVLGGMGVARYLQVVHGVSWLTPLMGAIVAALSAAMIIAWATTRGGERSDSVLSIVWALGMAIGITFIMITPGYGQDLTGYLFGNILMINPTDLVLMAVVNGIVLVLILLFYNRVLTVCFHEESALVRGIPVGTYTVIMLVLTALTIVLLVQVVGVVLVIALLTIPAATASGFIKQLSSMMVLAGVVCFVTSFGGLVVSYGPGLPVGATIIEFAAIVYLLSFGVRRLLKMKRHV